MHSLYLNGNLIKKCVSVFSSVVTEAWKLSSFFSLSIAHSLLLSRMSNHFVHDNLVDLLSQRIGYVPESSLAIHTHRLTFRRYCFVVLAHLANTDLFENNADAELLSLRRSYLCINIHILYIYIYNVHERVYDRASSSMTLAWLISSVRYVSTNCVI